MTVALIALLAGAAESDADRLEFPHAGVSLNLPTGFTLQRPGASYEVFSAGRVLADKSTDMAMTLATIPVNAETTLDDFANAIIAERALAIRKLEELSRSGEKIGNLELIRRRVRYEFRGQPYEARQVFFFASVPLQQQFKLGYMLTLEAHPETAGQLDAVESGVLGSLEFVPVKHAFESPLMLPDEPTALPQLGVSVAVPRDWKVESVRNRFKTYQFDYLLGGVPYPMYSITVEPAEPGTDIQQAAKQCMEAGRTLWGEENFSVLEQGAATVNAQPAWEITMQVRHQNRLLTGVQSFVIRDGKLYTLILCLQGDHVSAAQSMFRTLTQTIAFFQQTPDELPSE